MAQPHTYDLIAAHLASWIEEQATQLAAGFRENGHAPFAAPASNAQKQAYYEAQFFNPDGSPNGIGTAAVEARIGTQNMLAAKAEVMARRAHRDNGADLAPPEGMSGTDL